VLIFEVTADEPGLGKMICQWEEGAALMSIRRLLEKFLFRQYCEEYEKKNGSKPEGLSEAEIQWTLDVLSVEALRLLKDYAPQIYRLTDMALSLIKIHDIDQNGGVVESSVRAWGELEGMDKFKKSRKKMTDSFKRIHNERIGHKRGREAGKKDRKPRAKRSASAATKRKKILAAMRQIGQDPIYRKAMAPILGISAKTLGGWLEDIREEFGEEWDDLIAIALSTGR
jgi:hypothetical protein